MSSAESEKARRERLAAALRENLRRRKDQGRARRQAGADQGVARLAPDGPAPDSGTKDPA